MSTVKLPTNRAQIDNSLNDEGPSDSNTELCRDVIGIHEVKL